MLVAGLFCSRAQSQEKQAARRNPTTRRSAHLSCAWSVRRYFSLSNCPLGGGGGGGRGAGGAPARGAGRRGGAPRGHRPAQPLPPGGVSIFPGRGGAPFFSPPPPRLAPPPPPPARPPPKPQPFARAAEHDTPERLTQFLSWLEKRKEHIIDDNTDTCTHVQGVIFAIRFSKDGSVCCAASDDRSLRLWAISDLLPLAASWCVHCTVSLSRSFVFVVLVVCVESGMRERLFSVRSFALFPSDHILVFPTCRSLVRVCWSVCVWLCRPSKRNRVLLSPHLSLGVALGGGAHDMISETNRRTKLTFLSRPPTWAVQRKRDDWERTADPKPFSDHVWAPRARLGLRRDGQYGG